MTKRRLHSPLAIRLATLALLTFSAALAGCTTSPTTNTPATTRADTIEPPKPMREFRGVWVATVANIDWPSKPGLPVEQQKAEAIAILDKAAELNLNVIVLQVRTSCDALYDSQLEPWSYFLTGEQGKAPDPFYDPLKFWIEEAHKRGLELHAWFNPFRAKPSGQSYPDAETHLSKTRPDLVKTYGNDKTRYLWLDPGEPDARAHSLAVFLDVVRRYDIDGVHIDDYFYPYPVDSIPFPDDPAWEKYLASGGTLARDDWRRDQINTFVRELYAGIKQIKPHVKFGISPFGIWKPGHPESIRGFNQFEKLYADARLWLNEGWCDYYSPQLYWRIDAPQQSFPALLAWWVEQNHRFRTLAPGQFTSRVGDKTRPYSVEQIVSQVFVARHLPGSSGTIHFSMIALLQNREGIADELKKTAYPTPALVPATTWIDNDAPLAPALDVRENRDRTAITVRITPGAGEAASKWTIYTRRGEEWSMQVVPATQTEVVIADDAKAPINAIAVAAVDRCGNESGRAVVQRDPPATRPGTQPTTGAIP
jgi:uncharacterized lipoprotein YddW (UPF0748 family)